MSILGIKSIPLMKETNRAWKSVPGMYFVARERSPESIMQHIRERNYEAIINLGRTDIETRGIQTPLFNPPELIRAVSTPHALRRTLGANNGDDVPKILPELRSDTAHWHKGSGGYGGLGKRYCPGPCGSGNDPTIQQHIRGSEYRVISVGDKIVQASRKGERRTKENGRNEFEYTWVGVEGIRRGGFIPLVKAAIERIPYGEFSVLGWDIIASEERPYVIEVNTSPGVNEATAGRIIREVRSQAQVRV